MTSKIQDISIIKDYLQIDHEFSWDRMFGNFLPPDANPYRKKRSAIAAEPKNSAATSLSLRTRRARSSPANVTREQER